MIFILIWLACGVICGFIAQSKHRNVPGWVILGLCFGIFAIIIVAVLPNSAFADGGRCPYCAGPLYRDAIVCQSCGRDIPGNLPRWEWQRKAQLEVGRLNPPLLTPAGGIAFQVGQDEKKCPFCAELIRREAIVCRYCGRDLPLGESTPTFQSEWQRKDRQDGI
jgi:hypothetical protein